MTDALNLPLSIAPMIDWTYTHFRVFMRLLAPNTLLYTEMQTTGAIQNNPGRALSYHKMEHPIALQLGGSDKQALSECAQRAEQAGYDEVNLNLGCPSDKVQAGHFGACLMRELDLVSECLAAMRQAVSIPITAKTRIGIDQQDSYEFFSHFAHGLVHAGAQKLVVHARKAWLTGLNPKQNRTIPPLNYDYVYRLKQSVPNIPIVINGNINKLTDINTHLGLLDGVMLGRLACDNPYKIAVIHHALYPEVPLITRTSVFKQYLDYLITEYQKGASLSLLIKPIFNLAYGLPGSSQWKQKLAKILQFKDLADFSNLTRYLFEIESTDLESTV